MRDVDFGSTMSSRPPSAADMVKANEAREYIKGGCRPTTNYHTHESTKPVRDVSIDPNAEESHLAALELAERTRNQLRGRVKTLISQAKGQHAADKLRQAKRILEDLPGDPLWEKVEELSQFHTLTKMFPR